MEEEILADLAQLCRACAKETDQYVEMKDTLEYNDIKLPFNELYNECSPIKISSKDQFSKLLCYDCLRELISCYEFRKKCKDSYDKFHATLASVKKRKEQQQQFTATQSLKKIKIEFVACKDEDDVEPEGDVDEEEEQEAGMHDGEHFLAEEEDEDEMEEEQPVDELIVGDNIEDVASCTSQSLTPDRKMHGTARGRGGKRKQLKNYQGPDDNPDLGKFEYNMLPGYNCLGALFEANGYLYVASRSTDLRNYLTCSSRRTCLGKAYINYDTTKTTRQLEKVLYAYRPHNHPKVLLQISKLRFLEETRQIALSANYPARKIYDLAIERHPHLKNLMPYKSLKNRLFRFKHHVENISRNTIQSFAEYLESNKTTKFCYTTNKMHFLQEVIIDDAGSAILLINTDLLTSLSSTELFVDASFVIKFADGETYTFLTICLSVNTLKLPVFYAILDSPTEEVLFNRVITAFKNKYAYNVHPERIMCDANPLLYKTLVEIYPHATTHVSLLYYMMNIYKQLIAKQTMKETSDKLANCRKILTYIYSLPLLPADQIVRGFEFIQAIAVEMSVFFVMEHVFDYIESYWIGEVTPQQFSVHNNYESVNCEVVETYKSIRTAVTRKKGYTLQDFIEKLILIEESFRTIYENNLSISEDNRAEAEKFNKVLMALWSKNYIDKVGLDGFFKVLRPFVDKMSEAINVWGFRQQESNAPIKPPTNLNFTI